MGETSTHKAEGSDNLDEQRVEDKVKASRGRDRALGKQSEDSSDMVMSTRGSSCYNKCFSTELSGRSLII
jgi:hypothetical protein